MEISRKLVKLFNLSIYTFQSFTVYFLYVFEILLYKKTYNTDKQLPRWGARCLQVVTGSLYPVSIPLLPPAWGTRRRDPSIVTEGVINEGMMRGRGEISESCVQFFSCGNCASHADAPQKRDTLLLPAKIYRRRTFYVMFDPYTLPTRHARDLMHRGCGIVETFPPKFWQVYITFTIKSMNYEINERRMFV